MKLEKDARVNKIARVILVKNYILVHMNEERFFEAVTERILQLGIIK